MAFSISKLGEKIGSPQASGKSLWPFLAFGVVAILLTAVLVPSFASTSVPLVFFLAPLWVPFLLVGAAWHQWLIYRHSAYIAAQKTLLLEIKPPRMHSKTPLAMEAVLSGLHIKPGESTWWSRSIQGKVRPWWSLEIASIEGQVHFYIWTEARFQRNVEAQVYAQYPGAQVLEVPDYARLVSGRTEEWAVFGADFAHTKPDPYPIKTYIDYGLDKPTKEYEQTDPLANLVEFLGTFGPGEQVWLQFPIQVHTGEKKYPGKKTAKGTQYTWRDEAAELIKDIREKTVSKTKYRDVFTGEMRETEGFPNPTKGESESMAAIERNTSKLAFDVGGRAVYIAKPDKFNGSNISGILGVFRQFSSESYNGFKPTRWMIPFNDYPWEPFLEKRKDVARRKLLDAYRRRQYFHEPYKFEPMVMSTEELATIFHIPSSSVGTPTLSRVQSATSVAPPNLPV